MAQGHQVHLWWVPDHQGILGNERVDAAARATMEESQTTTGEYFVMRTMLQGSPPVVSGSGQISGVQHSGNDSRAFQGGDSPQRFGLDAGDAIQIHGCQGRPILDRSLPHGGVPSLIWSPSLPPL